ncbi:MAG: Rrf2 family transcriptional regulator [Actinomycetota bacterium]|nr:Rrf2 family transcriptional regulator [Actinomycetota bacterium]
MHISAKADYAMRALLALTADESDGGLAPVRAEDLARSQGLPVKFVENILVDLRRAGIVASQRGGGGGYRLARPASAITPADVIRALDGPLADVRGLRPEAATYEGSAEHLRDVWVAARASLRSVLERVTLADIVSGHLPDEIHTLTLDPDAWRSH